MPVFDKLYLFSMNDLKTSKSESSGGTAKGSSTFRFKNLNSSISPNKSSSTLFLTSPKPIEAVHLIKEVPKQTVTNLEDYFERMYKEQDLNLRAKHESDQIMKDSYKDHVQQLARGEVLLNTQVQDADESLIQMEREYANVQALEEKLVQQEIADLEKVRRQIAMQVVDVEQDYYSLRVDQITERSTLDKRRKELTQKLLGIEDKIQKLRHSLVVERRNHHFSSNQALHNSQLDLSIISMQKDYVAQWEHDPERDKRRQEFVDRQMKEWQENYDKREQKVKEMEKDIKEHEEQLKKLRAAKVNEKNAIKRKEITEYLATLEKTQEERIKEFHRTDAIVAQILKTKTLAEKYAMQDAKFMIEEINHRQEKLKQIAEQYKPIDLESINEHDRKFLDLHGDKLVERDKKCAARASEWNKFKAGYFSEGYRKAQEDAKIMKNPHEDDHKKAQEKLEKHRTMQKKILEEHLPKIDEHKQEELVTNISHLQHQLNFKSYQKISKNVKSKRRFEGISEKILAEQKVAKAKMIKLKPLEKLPCPLSPRSVGKFYLEDRARFNKKRVRSQSPENDVAQPNVVKLPVIAKTTSDVNLVRHDYLKEMRLKNTLRPRDILHDWEDLAIQQRDEGDKKPLVGDRLIQEAKKIERIAKQNEQLLRARNVSDNRLIADEEAVDNMFVNSIKAKLFVLDKDARITLPEKRRTHKPQNSELYLSNEYSSKPLYSKKESKFQEEQPVQNDGSLRNSSLPPEEPEPKGQSSTLEKQKSSVSEKNDNKDLPQDPKDDDKEQDTKQENDKKQEISDEQAKAEREKNQQLEKEQQAEKERQQQVEKEKQQQAEKEKQAQADKDKQAQADKDKQAQSNPDQKQPQPDQKQQQQEDPPEDDDEYEYEEVEVDEDEEVKKSQKKSGKI